MAARREQVADANDLTPRPLREAENSEAEAPAGYIIDFISREQVRDTPEEREALQVFARKLVRDHGYPRELIRTRPQYRVRLRPSGGRSFPVDIAVFREPRQHDDDLHIVVECKRKARKDGVTQLKRYLDMSAAEIGVWFNGDEHYYVQKLLHPDGSRTFEELPNIPKFGQRIEDVGLHRRGDLVAPTNLKATFRDLRNYLAGNASGITRDEALAQEIINLLFCKIYDEVDKGPDDIVDFRHGHNEGAEEVRKRIVGLFDRVKLEYPEIFDQRDQIDLDARSLAYAVGELQTYCLINADRDAVGEAFEVFIGPALRGAEGQFFTPRNVVRTLVKMVDPQPGEMIIDPACGSGGFLTVALEHVWEKLDAEGVRKGWSQTVLNRRKLEIATRTFRGLDKDAFLAKCTKAYMAILGDGRGGVFRVDSSLSPREEWPAEVQEKVRFGQFHVVLTNPPFGKRIRVTGSSTLRQFELAHRWVTDRSTGERVLSDQLHNDYPPQLLFLERSLQLLRPGGRLGIVLPESLFGSPTYAPIVRWLTGKARILAVAAMPEPLFKTGGKSGTHTKVCILVLQKLPASETNTDIFMADAKWCGHDSRGNETAIRLPDGTKRKLDDLPLIAERYVAFRDGIRMEPSHLGFPQRRTELVGEILVPKYYDPELYQQLRALENTHELVSIGELIDQGALHIATGVEVGKMAYGTGPVPFIRTSDLSNWEIKADPKQGVSEGIYEQLRAQYPDKFDVRSGDILLVRDGTYLVGTSAVISDLDTRILYQSHLFKLRVLRPGIVDPWLLFAALNSPIVRRQIRARRFTQDIIDTLGNRLVEVRVPIPRDKKFAQRVSRDMRDAIQERALLREQARRLSLEVEGESAIVDLESLAEAE